MIFTDLDGSIPFFRAHTPRWASQPLSGAGAALKGGRLNRPGVHALYLADSTETAIAEYVQLSSLMPALTLVQYQVVLQRVVDFRQGYAPGAWQPLWQELNCNWRNDAFLQGAEPPSWVIADEVQTSGATGVLFPSTKGKGVNLVIYTDALSPEDRISVLDPTQALPRDQSSWPR